MKSVEQNLCPAKRMDYIQSQARALEMLTEYREKPETKGEDLNPISKIAVKIQQDLLMGGITELQ